MADSCPSSFDQALLSGYLDGELRQSVEQKVRVHLEDCAACRAVYEDLTRLREATMTTRFQPPEDSQWDEAPRGGVSRISLGLGWSALIVWLVSVAVYGLWHLWQSPQALLEKLLLFGGILGLLLIFLSVLVDRIKVARDDPYREVEK